MRSFGSPIILLLYTVICNYPPPHMLRLRAHMTRHPFHVFAIVVLNWTERALGFRQVLGFVDSSPRFRGCLITIMCRT